jgi:hypothetical protein
MIRYKFEQKTHKYQKSVKAAAPSFGFGLNYICHGGTKQGIPSAAARGRNLRDRLA